MSSFTFIITLVALVASLLSHHSVSPLCRTISSHLRLSAYSTIFDLGHFILEAGANLPTAASVLLSGPTYLLSATPGFSATVFGALVHVDRQRVARLWLVHGLSNMALTVLFLLWAFTRGRYFTAPARVPTSAVHSTLTSTAAPTRPALPAQAHSIPQAPVAGLEDLVESSVSDSAPPSPLSSDGEEDWSSEDGSEATDDTSVAAEEDDYEACLNALADLDDDEDDDGIVVIPAQHIPQPLIRIADMPTEERSYLLRSLRKPGFEETALESKGRYQHCRAYVQDLLAVIIEEEVEPKEVVDIGMKEVAVIELEQVIEAIAAPSSPRLNALAVVFVPSVAIEPDVEPSSPLTRSALDPSARPFYPPHKVNRLIRCWTFATGTVPLLRRAPYCKRWCYDNSFQRRIKLKTYMEYTARALLPIFEGYE